MGVPAFGRLLARLRQERGLSQAEFAALLSEISGSATITRHEISRYETGARTPQWWLPSYARALDIPVVELRRALAAHQLRGVEPTESTAGDLGMLFSTNPGHGGIEEDAETEAGDRIAFVAHRPTRLDAAAVAALDVALAAHRRLDDSLPAQMLLPIARAQHRTVSRLARDVRGPHTRPLCRVAAEWTQFLGWLYAEARHDTQAIHVLAEASEQADAIADGTLAAQAENFLGYVERQRCNPRGIARHFLAAHHTPGANLHQRIGDAAQAAHGYALLGDRRAASRLLAEASDLTERADTTEPPETAYWLTPTFHRMGIGLTWIALGNHREAADNLRTGLNGIPDDQTNAEWTREYHQALNSIQGTSPSL